MTARAILTSIEEEYERYRALGEGAMAQLSDAELCQGSEGASSIATMVWHLAGNLESRFTDFMESDGEKPWRNRDDEFVQRTVTREELMDKWARGWGALESAIAPLTDDDLTATVTIRSIPHTLQRALHRSLAHTAYHVGQIVYVAKAMRGGEWKSLSIPLGKSQEFNRSMGMVDPRA